jgi:hypothetical protein
LFRGKASVSPDKDMLEGLTIGSIAIAYEAMESGESTMGFIITVFVTG